MPAPRPSRGITDAADLRSARSIAITLVLKGVLNSCTIAFGSNQIGSYLESELGSNLEFEQIAMFWGMTGLP